MRRGEAEIHSFSEQILENLNQPRNVAKGGWRGASRGDLLAGLQHEVAELTEEVAYTIPDPERVREEAADVAAYALMLHDWVTAHFDEGWEKLEDMEREEAE